MGLEEGDDLAETFITPVLKLTQDTGSEEDLGVTQSVVILLQLKGTQHLVSHHLTINKALGDGIGGKDGVSEMNQNGLFYKQYPLNLR